MADKIKWIEFKEKKILYLDYRGLNNEDEMINLLEEFSDYIKTINTKVLLLTNYTDTYSTQKYLDKLKENGKKNALFFEKSAVIGIEGIKKVLFKTYTFFTGETNIKLFNNEDDAKEWLVS